MKGNRRAVREMMGTSETADSEAGGKQDSVACRRAHLCPVLLLD